MVDMVKLKLKIVPNTNSTSISLNEVHLTYKYISGDRFTFIYNMSNNEINELRMLKIFPGYTFIERLKL